jgi:hypothetical protein
VPALKPISDGLLHRVAFSVRVYRRQESKKREKRKNRAPKIFILGKIGSKSLKNRKKTPVKQGQTELTLTFEIAGNVGLDPGISKRGGIEDMIFLAGPPPVPIIPATPALLVTPTSPVTKICPRI